MIKRVTTKPTVKVLKGNATYDTGIGGAPGKNQPKKNKLKK